LPYKAVGRRIIKVKTATPKLVFSITTISSALRRHNTKSRYTFAAITKTGLLETESSTINKMVKITEKTALIPNKSVLCLLCL
jgi:hypothetical protein